MPLSDTKTKRFCLRGALLSFLLISAGEWQSLAALQAARHPSAPHQAASSHPRCHFETDWLQATLFKSVFLICFCFNLFFTGSIATPFFRFSLIYSLFSSPCFRFFFKLASHLFNPAEHISCSCHLSCSISVSNLSASLFLLTTLSAAFTVWDRFISN